MSPQREQPSQVQRTGGAASSTAAALRSPSSFAMAVSPNTILDAELVVLDDDGRSQFEPLLRRRAQPVYYGFDILWLAGADLRGIAPVRCRATLHGLSARPQRLPVRR
jgi:hypothetical protein